MYIGKVARVLGLAGALTAAAVLYSGDSKPVYSESVPLQTYSSQFLKVEEEKDNDGFLDEKFAIGIVVSGFILGGTTGILAYRRSVR